MSASLCGMFGGLRMSRPAPVPMAFKASLSPLHMRGTPWHGFARSARYDSDVVHALAETEG